MSMFFRRLFVGLLCLALYSGAGWLPLAGSGGGGGGTTTFDPVNIGDITLSGGNLIASLGAGGGGYQVARSLTSHSIGKYYFEITDTNDGGNSNNVCVGIANSSQSLTTFLGASGGAFSAGAFGASSGWQINGGSSGSTPSWVQSNTTGVAFDAGGQLIWLRNTGTPGTWNAGGTANPATGVGGVSISSISGPYFAATCMNGSGTGFVMTANFGATSYVASAPSGFGNM